MRESKRREEERGATMRATSNAEQGQLVKKVKQTKIKQKLKQLANIHLFLKIKKKLNLIFNSHELS